MDYWLGPMLVTVTVNILMDCFEAIVVLRFDRVYQQGILRCSNILDQWYTHMLIPQNIWNISSGQISVYICFEIKKKYVLNKCVKIKLLNAWGGGGHLNCIPAFFMQLN